MPEPKLISSPDNPKYKHWKVLLESRGIKKAKQFLIFGERVVRETLQDHPERCVEVIYPISWDSLYSIPSPATVSSFVLENTLFQTLDLFGTRAPLLICETPSIPTWGSGQAPQGMEVLCPLGDPSNMGAVLRTCQALGVQKVILLKEAASPFHPQSIRAASGATLSIDFVHGPSIKDLNKTGTLSTIVALDASGNDMTTFQWPKNVRILIGEEGQGLPESTFPQKVAIPMIQGMHSLNAVVAASIAMYAYRLQHPM